MNVADIVDQVDAGKIYQHILKLEGTRHPIASPQELNEAADYIVSEFTQYGLVVNEHKFKIPHFDSTFRNIEGLIEGKDGPELLIVSHYDTVENCPGANDNASAVAVMLEAARVLSKQEDLHNVRFISFTLEESNPTFVSRARAASQRLGLTDARNRYISLKVHKTMGKFWQLYGKYWMLGNSSDEALAKTKTELETKMSDAMVKYVGEIEAINKGITATSWPGEIGAIGSSFWVERALQANRKVLGVLCLETIGYTSLKEYSQHFPAGMSARKLKMLETFRKMRIPYRILKPFLPPGVKPEMIQTHKADNLNVGNFLLIVGDANSGKLTKSFFAQCKLSSIDLPCISFQVPLRYEQIATGMSFFLRSDHAPFWRQGIPALFLTDTADYRYPYYHTPADTIGKLDFDFMTKICKATVATTINLTSG